MYLKYKTYSSIIIKFLFIVVSLFLLNRLSAATLISPQNPDVLIYNSDTFNIYNLIIDDLIDEILETNGELFSLKFRDGMSFNCWKGYQVVYEIVDDKILLNAIVGCGSISRYFEGDKSSVKSNIQNKIIEFQKGKWIKSANTELIIRKNDNLIRWDGVFDRVYENELLLTIKNGKIVRDKNILNYIDKINRINRRNNDIISNILFEAIKELDWTYLDKYGCADGDTYLISINSKGKIVRVSFLNYKDDELDEYWDNKEYKMCINFLKKSLSKLQFDQVFWHGKKFNDVIHLTIFYSDGKLENWSE